MPEYMLKVTLEDMRYCDRCDVLDRHSRENPYCPAGEFEMREELTSTDKYPWSRWKVIRPKGCPLREVEGK